MGKIDDIKEECIAIDLANVNDGHQGDWDTC